jgi:small-conductance mechanosensitive channel
VGLFLVAVAFGFTPETATAEETQVPTTKHEAEVVSPLLVPTTPVLLDGEILFHVRGLSAYPAEMRAQKIAERIEAFAADATSDPHTLRLVEEKNMTAIFADKQRLLGVFDADGRLEGIERQDLAQVYVERIKEAVQAYRDQRKSSTLFLHTLYALGASGVLASAWFGLQWVFIRLDALIERRYRGRVKDVTIQKARIFQARQMWAVLLETFKAIKLLFILALVYAYLSFVLRLFPWTAYLGKQLFTVIVAPLRTIGMGIVENIPNLIIVGILLVLTSYVLKLGRVLFDNVARGKITLKGFDQEWAWPTYRIFRALVVVFFVVMAYPHIPGSDTQAFKGVTIFLGVLLSLGSTSVIGNILAGYTLVYRRAFRIGDRVKIGEYLGDVMERRLLVTHLRSVKNEEIIVPNSEILNSSVINYSSLAKQDGLILHPSVGIGYETPWRQVEAILLEAASRTPGLLKHPEPFVLHKSLGDFCVTYELNVYCDQPHNMVELNTLLCQNILDVFNEHEIQIMTPAYVADPAHPKIVPKERWCPPPAKPPQNAGTDKLHPEFSKGEEVPKL